MSLVSHVVAAGRALVVIDADPDAGQGAPPLSRERDPVLWSFVERGLRVMPGFLGAAVAETDAFSLSVTGPEVRLAAGDATVLATPAAEIPLEWTEAVGEHTGVVLVVGRGLGVHDAPTGADAARALDAAAKAGRAAGGVVSVDLLA